MFKHCIKGTADILLTSETKLDKFILIGQFEIDGIFTPFRGDRDKNRGYILLWEKLLTKLVSFRNDDSIE